MANERHKLYETPIVVSVVNTNRHFLLKPSSASSPSIRVKTTAPPSMYKTDITDITTYGIDAMSIWNSLLHDISSHN